MNEHSFDNLLLICVVACLVPLVLQLLPRLRLPSVVVEIGAGVLLGATLLNVIEIDEPVAVLSWLGLAFLLFLAGLEIDTRRLRGPALRQAGWGYLLTLALATPFAVVAKAAGWAPEPILLVIVLAATSLALVVPVLRDSGQIDTALGQGLIVACTVADLASIILLSILFGAEGSFGSRVAVVASFIVAAALVAVSIVGANRWSRLRAAVAALQDSTAQIKVRLALALLVGLTALAGRIGLETILGAFLAGVVLSVASRGSVNDDRFRASLDAVGFGLLIPVFYVVTGLRLDLVGLLGDPTALLRVPVFLLALLVARGAPALLYARSSGTRGAIAAALLQATSLPFIATATQLGLELGLMTPVSASALVLTGVLTVTLFPATAFALFRTAPRATPSSGCLPARPDPLPDLSLASRDHVTAPPPATTSQENTP